MGHSTPTQGLLATTLQPLVIQLSGSCAQSARLMARCLHDESTPTTMAEFERTLQTLLREGGQRMMAWVLNHLARESDDGVASRLPWEGRRYRRRRQPPRAVSTLFGTVDVWRRRYAPLERGQRSLHP